MKLSTYCKPRGSQAALARAVKVPRQLIGTWGRGERSIPIRHCLPIERATRGEVMRWDLRDDWHELWPSLKRRKDAPRT
jgi:DNA-binding transcriptional regulator YdaS (Cro superfamily)